MRVMHPYKYLIRNGVQATVYPEGRVPQMLKTGIPDHNIFVAARRVPRDGRLGEMIHHTRIIKQRGAKMVYEVDDDPFSSRFYANPDELEVLFREYDAAIVSTRRLAERLRPHIPNTYVFWNHLDHEVWDVYEDQRDPEWVTVGISGSPTHYDDWLLAADALYKIAQTHSHVRFVAFGFCPDYLEGLPRLEIIGDVPYHLYPAPLKRLDIGLAPLILDDEGFNLYKSGIKALDYGLAGALPLASDHPVYRQVRECARLVKDDEWFEALNYWVTHPSELRRARQRAERWVRRNRILKDGWRGLARIFRSILKD